MMTEYTISTQRTGMTFTGVVIGSGTSEIADHSHRERYITDIGSGRPSCSACRWFEVTLYRTEDGRYVAHTVGRSVIPGEIDFARVVSSTSALEIVDMLTVRRQSGSFLPAPSSRALAYAAETDDEIRYAYVNRAVV